MSVSAKLAEAEVEYMVRRALEDFEAFCRTCFHIRCKDGRVRPLVPNGCQRKVLAAIAEQEKAGQPVRVVVCKARQLGMSTLVAARFLWRAIRDTNLNALILAHTKDTARLLLSIVQFGYRNLPPWFVEAVGIQAEYETKYDLVFAHTGSQLSISSADAKEPGRAGTIHLLHLSEAAFYEEPESLTRSVFAAVPDHPVTEVGMESTGNGPNWFASRYMAAKQGMGGWKAVFLPWYAHEEYRAPADGLGPLDEEEEALLRLGATPENLAWRRRKLESDYEGDVARFRLEFPSTDSEAFVVVSASVFDPAMIQRRMLELEGVALREGFVVWNAQGGKFVEASPGNVLLKEEPKPGRAYVIGADVGSGISRGEDDTHSYSCADVLDAATGEQVAHLHEKAEPAVYAQHLEWLGRYYNTAMIAVEVTGGHGLAVLNHLRDAGYPNLYRRRVYDRVSRTWQDVLGWNTTPRTKQLAIDALRADFRQGFCVVNVRETLEEMLSFVEQEKGGLGAVAGAHDDRVMSLSIANWVRREVAQAGIPLAAATAGLPPPQEEEPQDFDRRSWLRDVLDQARQAARRGAADSFLVQ